MSLFNQAEPLRAISSSSGREHLTRRSKVTRRLKAMLPIASVLIIDDNDVEGEALMATLRLILGHDTPLHFARRLPDARRLLQSEVPAVVFLDDRLGHSVSAEVSLSMLRASGYTGKPILLSGMLTRARLIELKRLEVSDIIHKDDLDALRIMEALLVALGDKPDTDVAGGV